MDDSVIIGGDYDFSRTTILNKLLLDMQLEEPSILTVSFRSVDHRPYLHNEIVFKTDVVDRTMLVECFRMRSHIVAFDTGYDYLFDKDFPAFLHGHTVFHSVPAFGETAEEMRDSAIENFFKLSGRKETIGFNKIIVTKLNDLGDEASSTVTEFLLNQESNV